MIKNKALDIKMILKTYLKVLKLETLQIPKHTFVLQNIKE